MQFMLRCVNKKGQLSTVLIYNRNGVTLLSDFSETVGKLAASMKKDIRKNARLDEFGIPGQASHLERAARRDKIGSLPLDESPRTALLLSPPLPSTFSFHDFSRGTNRKMPDYTIDGGGTRKSFGSIRSDSEGHQSFRSFVESTSYTKRRSEVESYNPSLTGRARASTLSSVISLIEPLAPNSVSYQYDSPMKVFGIEGGTGSVSPPAISRCESSSDILPLSDDSPPEASDVGTGRDDFPIAFDGNSKEKIFLSWKELRQWASSKGGKYISADTVLYIVG